MLEVSDLALDCPLPDTLDGDYGKSIPELRGSLVSERISSPGDMLYERTDMG